MLANCSLGSHPASINNAVIRPQAMKAPILGITIALKNLPNFWTAVFILSLLFYNIFLG